MPFSYNQTPLEEDYVVSLSDFMSEGWYQKTTEAKICLHCNPCLLNFQGFGDVKK